MFEQITQQLNFGFQQDIKDESTSKEFFPWRIVLKVFLRPQQGQSQLLYTVPAADSGAVPPVLPTTAIVKALDYLIKRVVQ